MEQYATCENNKANLQVPAVKTLTYKTKRGKKKKHGTKMCKVCCHLEDIENMMCTYVLRIFLKENLETTNGGCLWERT